MKDCKGHNCQHAEPEQHSAECIAEHQCARTGIEPIEVVTYFANMLGLTTEQMVKWAANGKANAAKLAGHAPHIQDRTGMRWWDVVCAMPRYSFWRGEQGDGIVNRVSDPTGNWVEVSAVQAMVEAIDIAFRQHDSNCSTNNRGVPDLLGPCDCSVFKAKPTCTDERPCVNCFSGQGECLAEQDRLSKIVSAALVKAQPGDLVVFRAEAGSVTADDVNAMRKYLNVLLPEEIRGIVVSGDLEITSMSEEQLKQVGLVRVGGKEPDDLTQFLEQTDFDAAEKVASATVDSQPTLPPSEDDCEGCKI